MFEFYIGTPQLIYLLLLTLSLGMELAQHGKSKSGVHSAWHTVIGLVIVIPLLYWGGFFTQH